MPMKLPLHSLRLALVCALALAAVPSARAQVNINIGAPSWGPALPAGAQYYFIPETNGFYDVRARQYVVRRDGHWTRLTNLTGYNTANFRPVVVDYVGAQPWTRYDEYRGKYGKKRNPSNGGLPPGQAKKQYRDRDDRDRDYERKRDIIRVRLPGGGYADERQGDDRRYEHDRDDDHDGRGKDKGREKGKGKKDKD